LDSRGSDIEAASATEAHVEAADADLGTNLVPGSGDDLGIIRRG
jgi:hypothetical protein